METRESNKPVGSLLAILPGEKEENEAGEKRKGRMLEIGAVWLTKSGNLSFQLEAWPVQWPMPGTDAASAEKCPRFVISWRKGVKLSGAPE